MEKKNTLLLTVIAIATLLVAVVGATFAYFTATESGTGSQEIQITTHSPQTGTFNGGSLIELVVGPNDMLEGGEYSTPKTADNFTKSGANPATVTFKASDGASEDHPESLCYTAKLNVTGSVAYINDHGKGTGTGNAAAAQVTLTAQKNNSPVVTDVDITENDIYYLPSSGSELSTTPKEHKITVNTSKGTLTDEWKISVSFWNRSYDQSANAEKTKNVAMSFDKVVCGSIH